MELELRFESWKLNPFRDVVLNPVGVPPLLGIDLDAVELHREMDVVASRHAGLAAYAHHLSLLHRIAFMDIYHGQKIDQQVHLGYDLAVTQHVGVQASNDGTVVYAAPLGIYGNCIVLDHGYGLQTIYGHLSRIDVHEGDTVKQGQVMGVSGMTGMAGGDHIHFAMQLDGVQIDPKEWWDAHWIKDHIAKRVDLPGFKP